MGGFEWEWFLHSTCMWLSDWLCVMESDEKLKVEQRGHQLLILLIWNLTINLSCQFQEPEVIIDKTNILGEGVFGKCYLPTIGPQKACIKVVRKNPLYDKSFVNEAHILSFCCNRNVTFLFDNMSMSRGYNCLILC